MVTIEIDTRFTEWNGTGCSVIMRTGYTHYRYKMIKHDMN